MWTEPHYRAWIPWIAGLVQTALYADFFYYFYACRVSLGMKAVILPLHARKEGSGTSGAM